jgi:hypothetical protein
MLASRFRVNLGDGRKRIVTHVHFYQMKYGLRQINTDREEQACRLTLQSLLLMERAIVRIYGIVTVIWFDGTLSTPLESTDFTS